MPPSLHLRRLSSVIACLLAAVALDATPLNLVVLHTNDVHDHLRPGENGLGGLPYVAGYVGAVRADESHVVVVDAGDVTEKGDLVAFRTHGVMTFEALGRIGYDGVALGNHDFDDLPLEHVRRFERALGHGILCLNVLGADGGPLLTGSRVIERGGMKIGLIGLIVPRKPEQGGLDAAESGRALAREAERLRAQGAFVIAVCHERPERCAEWSRQAPAVQVFVSGHSHTAMHEPAVVPETGAIIVQAGSYARWVGRLELEIDPATRRVTRHAGRLVPMEHSRVPVDAALLAWVAERERALAPEAATFVCDNPAVLDGFSVARLAAAALRQAAGAEIGFCHTYQVIRDTLPAGPVDVNAVFKTGGHRGHHNVLVDLTGAEIGAYVNALVAIQRETPEWSGFRVTRRPEAAGAGAWETDLDATRRYRVVMPRIEWETRYLRLAEAARKRDPASPLGARAIEATPAPVNFTDATVAYIRQVMAAGEDLRRHALRLAEEREN